MTDPMESFLCPITHELMTDPVIDPDGNSYERSAIENWLKQHSTSPITRTPLSMSDLRPNRALRTSIEQFRGQSSTESSVTHVQVDNASANNQASFELKLTSSWANGLTHISIQPPEGAGARAPCDICCVVDTSGSMGIEVEVQNSNDNKEKYGLSRLDLVKHALKTIVHSLTSSDRLSIVSFSNSATVLFKLHQMDDDGRSTALAALERLDDNGQTNLWDGLRTGLDVLAEGQRATGSNVALFLLTDGCPNVEPPRGHLPTLAAYKDKKRFTCSINTFGFGYEMDSKLLEDLAQMGNSGSYAFIPDGSFVGTIFVNAISNLLTTAATNVQLTVGGGIQIDPSSELTRWYSSEQGNGQSSHGHEALNAPSIRFNLGSITFGQSKDILLPLTIEQHKTLQIKLVYESPSGQKIKKCEAVQNIHEDAVIINRQLQRLRFVDCIRTALESMRSTDKTNEGVDPQQIALKNLKSLEESMRQSSNDPYIVDLLKDLTDQVQQAFSRLDWFKKWGVHYLPSLTRAHLLQQCNNFKDPGVQHYGQGELFTSVRDEMDGIFCALPAPKRSQSGAPIDMTVFNNADNPCFHGSCVVRLIDGSIKLVKDVRRGDRLFPHGGRVDYVLRTVCTNGQAQMVLLDTGLIITPWHPVRLNGIEWVLPCSLVRSPTEMACEAVYSFALDGGHTVWVNDVQCVTLGHGFKEDVVRHAYYGTNRVIEDLRLLDGQQNCTGLVEMHASWVLRSKRTGLVNGIRTLLFITSAVTQN